MQITNKDQMYTLLMKGVFGNCFRNWKTGHDVIEDNYSGLLSIRNKKIGGLFFHQLPTITALMLGEQLIKDGDEIVFAESAPDWYLTLNGELCEVDWQLYLMYSTERVNMREAMKKPSFAEGLAAKTILRSYLSPSSYEDIMALLETYPRHVIEFSSFECFVGNLKGRNAVQWECRLY